jgi:hypothetical protein
MAEGPTAVEVLERAQATYDAMPTYSSEGTVRIESEGEVEAPLSIAAFSMKIGKPNRFLFAWSQSMRHLPEGAFSGAAWSDGTQPYVFFLGAYAPMNSDEVALGTVTGVSHGAAFNIPTLLLPVMPQAGRLLDRVADPELDGPEPINGEECHVVKGMTPGIGRIKLWISQERGLILRLQRWFDAVADDEPEELSDEDMKEALEAMGLENTPENRARIKNLSAAGREAAKGAGAKSYSFVETHTDISSPDLQPEDFRFTVPEGTQRKENLFEGMPGIGQE